MKLEVWKRRTVSQDDTRRWSGSAGEYRTDDILSNGGDGRNIWSSLWEMSVAHESFVEIVKHTSHVLGLDVS